MSEESQRVVVIHLASRGFNTKAIKLALNDFSPEQGDNNKLTLLAILRHVKSRSSVHATAKFWALFGSDQKIVEEEFAKKKEKLHNNPCIKKISEQCEKHKIQFLIDVVPGKLPDVAVNAALRLKAK